jgi:hypothetical protein
MSLKKHSCSTLIFNEGGKPEMIAMYYATKSGEDVLYQKFASY